MNMTWAGRIVLSFGIGAMLFAAAITTQADFFITDFYTFTGFAALVLYVFDYLNYFFAT